MKYLQNRLKIIIESMCDNNLSLIGINQMLNAGEKLLERYRCPPFFASHARGRGFESRCVHQSKTRMDTGRFLYLMRVFFCLLFLVRQICKRQTDGHVFHGIRISGFLPFGASVKTFVRDSSQPDSRNRFTILCIHSNLLQLAPKHSFERFRLF